MKEEHAAGCAEILERVSAYLDQELDADTCRAIDAHCSDCESCARFVQDLRATIGLCRATAARPLPAEVTARARARIDRLLGDLLKD